MQKMKKITAVLTMLLLVGSVLTILAIPAEGQIPDPPEDRDDFVSLSDQLLSDQNIYVGEQEVQFAVEVEALEQDANYNITDVWVEMDPDDELPVSWVNQEEIPADEGANMTVGENNTYVFGSDGADPEPFEFDVDENADPGTYQMDVRIYYTHANETGDIQDTHLDTYIDFEIMNNVEIVNVDPSLTPGEDFQELEVEIENQGDETLSNISLTLDQGDLPDDSVEFSRAGGNEASYEGGDELPSGNTGSIYYRVDVDQDTDPGTHTIGYDLEADRHDDEIVSILEDESLDIELEIAPIIEAHISDVEQPGPTEMTFNVSFENTGNVDLYDVEVSLLTDDDLFLKSVDHYEYGADITEPEIDIGDLSEGDMTDEMEFEIGLDRYLQDGNHRLLFDWEGYFYHEDDDRYYEVGVNWVNWDDPNLPTRAEMAWADGDDDDWFGPEVFIEIERDEIYFSGDSDYVINLDGDITSEVIEVEITNHELVDFSEVEAQLEVGDNTPFFNPANRSRDYVEMDGSAEDLDADDTEEFTFTVDINKDFVSEKIGEGAHTYEATVMITQAVNDDTNEEVTGIEVSPSIEISGYGPNLVVDAELSDHDIKAGENFTLEYTIRNEGDEAARETSVEMIPNLYENDWEIIDGYIRALASSSEKYAFGEMEEIPEERSKNTSHLEMDLLGVEDGEDIVDLHMYIEGSLSAPSPHISTLYVGEINPGDEYTVSFEMVASEHMQIGQPYQETIEIDAMDANGDTYEEEYETTISLAGAPEETDEPAEVFGMDAAVFGVILVIIILVIVLAVSLASRKTGGKEEEEEEAFEEMEEETEIEEEVEEPIEEDELFEEPEEPEEPLEEEPSDMDEDEEEW